jgi:H+/Cl- antiporter ClcA
VSLELANPKTASHRADRWPALFLVTILVGVGAGLGGTGLGLLLRFVQHLAYGYSLDTLSGRETFLAGVSAASPLRRLLALTVCAVIAAAGWWLLYRFGKPLVSIAKAIAPDAPKMPLLSTLVHDLLQIITVALGSPLGREVAPRELGAVLASWLADRAALSSETTRTLIACGAGAGLAAVYNVPLGGTLFILEVLLCTFRPAAAIPAMVTCGIATVISWAGLGTEPQYLIPAFSVNPALLVWSLIVGPIFGCAAYGFVRLAGAALSRAPKDWRLAAWSLTVFPAIGLLAMRYPQILGNGKSIARLGFENELGLALALVLTALKVVVVVASLRAGAAGGLLTPGIALGVLIGTITSSLWNLGLPGLAPGACALIGAAAFLASSMRMPLTAIALVMEFTRPDVAFLTPMTLAVAGSVAASQLLRKHRANREQAGHRAAAQTQPIEAIRVDSAISEEAPIHSE